jgi:LysM repeat protein
MKRVNEIKVKISLGMEIVYEYDFPWMGKLDRNEHNALQRLENPISRLKEEIFWFWFETDCDTKAINHLIQNNREGAHNAWEALTGDAWDALLIPEGNPTKESMSAFINQIVLTHSNIIGEECIIRSGDEIKKQKEKNITLDEKHWKKWFLVIEQFTLIASNKLFWEMVKNKAEKIDDPRLSAIKVEEICDNFIQDIIEPNFTFMSDALISKDYERVKQHSSLLIDDWIPGESPLPLEVLRKGFNGILLSQTDLLNRHAQNAAKELKRVKKGEEGADKKIISIYSKLIDDVKDIIYEGNLVDPNSISDFALAKNEVAKVIRNCAIILNNILLADTYLPQDEKENKIYKIHQAYEMIKKALEYATTTYTRQEHKKDEELLKNNLRTAQVNNFTQESNKQTSKRSNWGGIFSFLFWGGIIFYFFIFPMFNNDNSSSNKTTTSTPPYSSSKPSTSTSSYNSSKTSNLQNDLSQLKIRIENLAEVIKKKETRISEFELWFESEKDKLEALESEIKWLELGIENTIVGKDELIDEYNQKIEEYDKIVNSYNKVYLEYDKFFDEYEKDITTHDSLVGSYNAGIIPPEIQNWLSGEEVSNKIYVVEAGDSLWKIAEKFGTTVEKIVALNELADQRLIKPGQKLIIPQNNN